MRTGAKAHIRSLWSCIAERSFEKDSLGYTGGARYSSSLQKLGEAICREAIAKTGGTAWMKSPRPVTQGG